MQLFPVTYLPLLTSVISLITTLAVALIGFRFSRSMESGKVRAAYLNYALQKIMDEYVNYNPIIDLSKADSADYLRLIEERFSDCRSSILRVSPLISQSALELLLDIEKEYSSIIRFQHNAKLRGAKPEPVSPDHYAQLLTNYINFGHELLKKQVETLRVRLEEGIL